MNRLLAVGPRRTLPRTQAYVVILGWKQVQVQDTLFQVHEGPQELKKKKKRVLKISILTHRRSRHVLSVLVLLWIVP